MRAGVGEASSIPSQVGMMAAVDERKDKRLNATRKDNALRRFSTVSGARLQVRARRKIECC